MNGILLKRSEFLTLLNATRAQAVVGFKSEELFPEEAKLRALVLEGIESLKQRGLLRVENDLHVIDTDLLALMMVVSYPQLAAITTRFEPVLLSAFRDQPPDSSSSSQSQLSAFAVSALDKPLTSGASD